MAADGVGVCISCVSPGEGSSGGRGTALAPHPLHRTVLWGSASQPQWVTVADVSPQP